MKKLYTLILTVLLTASTFAQAPEKMSYQAVVRDAANALVTNTQVGMQISILQGGDLANPGPTIVYSETQTPTTNANGLVTLEIGTGTTTDDFTAIDWANGPYFIQTGTDPTGGTTYTTLTSTSQLMSVPFALHTKHAANGLPSGGLEGQVVAINDSGAPEWTNPSIPEIYYKDTDGDGYGDINNPIVAFSMSIGYASNNTDCDDTPISGATIYPGATEVVDDGIDQDCDGLDVVTWYADVDGDTYGDAASTTTASTKPTGYVADNTDCNDTLNTGATINPGALEVLGNNIDDNCNGEIDELIPSISGGIYFDLNGDGSRNVNESNFLGVIVNLTDSDGTILTQTQTDANGIFLFPNLPAGTYYVEVPYDGVPTGFVLTTANNPLAVMLYPNQKKDLGYIFGFKDTATPSIGGSVWIDTNIDGIRNPEEQPIGIKGVVVKLTYPDGSNDFQITDANGNYLFTKLAAETTYSVEVTNIGVPTGYVATTPTTISWTPNFAENYLDANFGFKDPASSTIGGYVWIDLNGDGIKRVNEPGIEGVVVNLTDSDGTFLIETMTDAYGSYLFNNLPAGVYGVVVTNIGVPTGYVATNMKTLWVTLQASSNKADINFGFKDPATSTIGDYVWIDYNGDGIKSVNESDGIQGVVVKLTYPDESIDIQLTDANGNYQFTNLPAGVYTVEVSNIGVPTGYVATTSTTFVVTLDVDESYLDADAGFSKDATAPDAPIIGTAIGGNGQASVTYTAPVNDGGSPITEYTATSSPGGFTGTLTQAGSGAITVTGLTNGISYTFIVTATNAIGVSLPSATSNSVTPTLQTVAIGDLVQGGIVFWVDPADNTKGKVCMLVADEKQLDWYSAMTTVYTNTDTGTGVYSDWYVPSKDELQLMYANLKRFGCSTNTPGGTDYDYGACATEKGNFGDYYYWSSTETDNGGVWVQAFGYGDQGNYGKSYPGNVRAVRAF